MSESVSVLLKELDFAVFDLDDLHALGIYQ